MNTKISNGVKILMLAEDPSILMSDSPARRRMSAYARACGELHVIVLTGTQSEYAVEEGLFLYPAYATYGLLRRWRMYRIARSVTQKISFSVISAQGPNEIGVIAYLIARQEKIPLQVQVHTDILSPWYARSSWKEYLRVKLARFLLPRADCIRVVSARIQRSLMTQLQIPADSITLLPIFKNLGPYQDMGAACPERARFAHYNFRMIAVGRFVEKEKNFCMLIEMMKSFVARHTGVVLALVGAGPDESRYRGLIAKYRLEKNIFIEPWRDDLAEFYKCFDAFLMPSRYEGWGLAALEAMASGLPVVMTDVGLAGEVLINGKNGVVVPVGDANGFYDACVDLFKNPARRAALADAARRTIAQLHPRTEEEYLEQYEKSFKQCARKDL